MVNNQCTIILALALSIVLSACVSQSFENGKTPVVQKKSNRDDMAATRISLGLGYLKMGNMSQAKQNLEKAKKFAPDMVQVYTAFAHYYEIVGEDKLTMESYEKALSIASEDADTLNNYGVYLCRQDQIDKAEVQLLKAIAVPSYLLVSKSYENLASCFLKKDNFDKAERYLNKAIRHNPSSASILFQMVQIQYAMGEYQQAKTFEQRFEKVTRRFTPQSLALAFKVYTKLGQKRTAKNYATMLVKMYPQSWQAQQYVLNELELIDADNLAKRYQLTQAKEQGNKPKKRIVKLSPKKAASTLLLAPASISLAAMASTQSISAVLSMAPTTEPKSIVGGTALMQEEPSANAVVNTDKSVLTSSDEPPAMNTTVAMTPITEQKHAKAASVSMSVAPSADAVANTDKAVLTSHSEKPVIVLIAANKPVGLDTNTLDEDQMVKAVKNKPSAAHIVAKGDTLYSISMKYNVKITALRRWNQLSTKKNIRINDKLFVENPTAVNQINE